MRYSTTTRRLTVAAAAALALGACKDPTSVPDLNNLPTAIVQGNLNQPTVQILVNGLANRDRDLAGFRYAVFAGSLARDVVNFDPSESRYQTELFGNAIDPAGFIGGSLFTEAYSSIRSADVLITKAATAGDLTAGQQNAVRGLAYTFKALALYRELELRAPYGIPLENREPGTSGKDLAPFVCSPDAFARISVLLDSGATALNASISAASAAGGTATFGVSLPAGFSLNGSFNTPATFLQFNRGLKGRNEFYRGLAGGGGSAAYTAALTALGQSFLSTTAPLANGVYFTYAASPDVFNPLAVGTIFLNQSITTVPASAPAFARSQVIQPGDLRASKLDIRSSATVRNGMSSNLKSTLASTAATNQTRPLPLLRNAELVLLRAQAEIELGQFQAATDDINVVRVQEGGLPPIPTITSRTEGVQRVLYEKRYSLLLEPGGSRLMDLRSYGLLNAANLGAPQRDGDLYLKGLPVPQAELDQRGLSAQPSCPTP